MRPGPLGNPFVIGRDGTREEVIEKFRLYANREPSIRAMLPSLRGKRLGCVCKPKACHGDVYVEMIEEEDRMDVITKLREFQCDVTPCGSRVTCDPVPEKADHDMLVVAPAGSLDDIGRMLFEEGFEPEGSEHYRQMLDQNTFVSWRNKDNLNLIVTADEDFARRHKVSTALCKRLNLLDKDDRIAVFQAVLYGKEHARDH
jgi:hypothetical protein